MATATSQNYLGRCKEDGCDYVIFATGEDVQAAESFRDVQAGRGVYRVGNNGCFARCANRHRVFACKLVKGTYSKDHACDSRCLNARGWSCTCSCGGANHGRGHVATVVQAADLNDREHFPGRDLRPEFADVPHTVEDYVPVRQAVDTLVDRQLGRHLGEVGKHISGEVFVKTIRSLSNGSVLYSFRTVNGGYMIKWFCPGHADPGFELGSTLAIRAKVKAHDEFNGTPETIVIYVEEVE